MNSGPATFCLLEKFSQHRRNYCQLVDEMLLQHRRHQKSKFQLVGSKESRQRPFNNSKTQLTETSSTTTPSVNCLVSHCIFHRIQQVIDNLYFNWLCIQQRHIPTAINCRSTKRLLLERYLSSYPARTGGRKRFSGQLNNSKTVRDRPCVSTGELIGTHGTAIEWARPPTSP